MRTLRTPFFGCTLTLSKSFKNLGDSAQPLQTVCTVASATNLRNGGPPRTASPSWRPSVIRSTTMRSGTQCKWATTWFFQQQKRLPTHICCASVWFQLFCSMSYNRELCSSNAWPSNCQHHKSPLTGGYWTCCQRAKR